MKNKIIIGLIISVVILSSIFIYFSFFEKSEKIKVIDVYSDKTHIVKEGKKVDGIKIISIEESQVEVMHLKETIKCEYNKRYEFWPDSQGGKIMWQAPQAILIFEKY